MDRRNFLACLGIGVVPISTSRAVELVEEIKQPASYRTMFEIVDRDPLSFKGHCLVLRLGNNFITLPIYKIEDRGTLDNFDGVRRVFYATLEFTDSFELTDAAIVGIMDANECLVLAFREQLLSRFVMGFGDIFNLSYAINVGSTSDWSNHPAVETVLPKNGV